MRYRPKWFKNKLKDSCWWNWHNNQGYWHAKVGKMPRLDNDDKNTHGHVYWGRLDRNPPGDLRLSAWSLEGGIPCNTKP